MASVRVADCIVLPFMILLDSPVPPATAAGFDELHTGEPGEHTISSLCHVSLSTRSEDPKEPTQHSGSTAHRSGCVKFAMMQRERYKRCEYWKRDGKLSLLADNMTIYTENPKESIKYILE